MQRDVARIVPLELRESQRVRLRRIVPKAVAKDDGEVAIPLAASASEVAPTLVALLEELIPPEPVETPALASASP